MYENWIKEINSYKNIINKLKKDNLSSNNIIIEIKSKIENEENNSKNNIKKINTVLDVF